MISTFFQQRNSHTIPFCPVSGSRTGLGASVGYVACRPSGEAFHGVEDVERDVLGRYGELGVLAGGEVEGLVDCTHDEVLAAFGGD